MRARFKKPFFILIVLVILLLSVLLVKIVENSGGASIDDSRYKEIVGILKLLKSYFLYQLNFKVKNVVRLYNQMRRRQFIYWRNY